MTASVFVCVCVCVCAREHDYVFYCTFIVYIYHRCTSLQISPVEPRQEAFGCSDQVHHGGEKVVGQLAGGSPVVMAAAPPARDEVLQVLGRCIQLVRESLQILGLQPVILEERGK